MGLAGVKNPEMTKHTKSINSGGGSTCLVAESCLILQPHG